MRKTAFFVLVATPLLACGGNTSSSSNGDLSLSQVFQDLAPAVCSRIQSCDPAGYQASFPNGDSDCESLFDQDDPNPSEVTTCTTSQAGSCADAIQNIPCDTFIDIGEGGTATISPEFTLPAVCDGC